ncbi:MAG: hypothetical protein R3F61_24925 [Myxococcota bacterium]
MSDATERIRFEKTGNTSTVSTFDTSRLLLEVFALMGLDVLAAAPVLFTSLALPQVTCPAVGAFVLAGFGAVAAFLWKARTRYSTTFELGDTLTIRQAGVPTTVAWQDLDQLDADDTALWLTAGATSVRVPLGSYPPEDIQRLLKVLTDARDRYRSASVEPSEADRRALAALARERA